MIEMNQKGRITVIFKHVTHIYVYVCVYLYLYIQTVYAYIGVGGQYEWGQPESSRRDTSAPRDRERILPYH